MKSYKEFDKHSLGYSDIASVVLRGCDNLAEMRFGGDGNYSAYVVTERAEIGEHYHEVFRCHNWLWVYDDDDRVLIVYGDEIIVYRAGNMGCIIYAPHDKEEN